MRMADDSGVFRKEKARRTPAFARRDGIGRSLTAVHATKVCPGGDYRGLDHLS